MSIRLASAPVYDDRKTGGSQMGEVRAKVRVVNVEDEVLARAGHLPADKIRFYEADALVDTGVVTSVIPVHVFQQLGVSVGGQRVAQYADGREEAVNVTGALSIRDSGPPYSGRGDGFGR